MECVYHCATGIPLKPTESAFYNFGCSRVFVSGEPVGTIAQNWNAKAFGIDLIMLSLRDPDWFFDEQTVYALLEYAMDPDGKTVTLGLRNFRTRNSVCSANYIQIRRNGRRELVVDPDNPESCSGRTSSGVDAENLHWFEKQSRHALDKFAACIEEKAQQPKPGEKTGNDSGEKAGNDADKKTGK